MAGRPLPWSTLPSDLLVAVLRQLPLDERHRAAVAVCKAWHAACYSPALLRQLSFRGGRGYGEELCYGLDRLACLGAWLVRRRPAQHANSVTFSLVLPSAGSMPLSHAAQVELEHQHGQHQGHQGQQQQQQQEQQQQQQQQQQGQQGQEEEVDQLAAAAQQAQQAQQHGDEEHDEWEEEEEEGSDWESDWEGSEGEDPHHPDSADEDSNEPDLMATCLAAVAATATPRLTSMQVSVQCLTLSMGAWPAGLTALTRLGFTNHEGGVRMSPQLRLLHGLRELAIVADRVSGQGYLPRNITRLTWAEASLVMFLPRQLWTLQRLQHLELGCPVYDAVALNAMTQLTSMRHLALNNTALPGALSQLTWLRSLRILDGPRSRCAELPAALPALQQLTALVLGYVRLWQPGLVAALEELQSLRRLVVCYVPDDAAASSMEWPRPQDLPAPAFMGRLAWVGLDADLLVRNPHLLAPAGQLQHLWLMGRCGCSPRHRRQWQQLVEVVGQLPQLRRICLRPSRGSRAYAYRPLEQHQRDDVAALQCRRPGLVCDESKFQPVTSNDDLWLPFFSD